MSIRRVPVRVPISGATGDQTIVDAQNSEEARRAITNIQERFRDDAELVWDDLRADIRQGDAAAALTWESLRTTGFIAGHMRHDQADTQFYVYQLPHRWAKTEVHPHIHFMPMATPASTRKFQLQVVWTWVPYNEEMQDTAGALWKGRIAESQIKLAHVNKHRIISLGPVAPLDSCRESSILLMTVRRYTTGDTYTDSKGYGTNAANIALLSADLHFQVEKNGTKQEYPK